MKVMNLKEQQLKKETTLCELEWHACCAIKYHNYSN